MGIAYRHYDGSRGFMASCGTDTMAGQRKLLNMDVLLKFLEAIRKLGPTLLYKVAKRRS